MKHHAAALMEALEAAARSAQMAETAYRADAAREIARLERERFFAFRRIRLVGLLASASAGAETEQAALAAQRRAVADEFGWQADGKDHAPVLDRLEEAGRLVWEAQAPAEKRPDAAGLLHELSAFEAWYQARGGEPFYALFDQYVPEVPLVDF